MTPSIKDLEDTLKMLKEKLSSNTEHILEFCVEGILLCLHIE